MLIFIGEPDRYLGSVPRAGRVVAVMGSVDGPNYDTGVALTRDMFDGPSGDDEQFGIFLTSGRFEDDNFDDLMIGSPLADYLGTDSGLFSSTDRTTAWAGGSTYRPTMSRSLAANSLRE